MAKSSRSLDHWIVIPDEDLRYIEDGPLNGEDVDAWIAEVQSIIADGLETA